VSRSPIPHQARRAQRYDHDHHSSPAYLGHRTAIQQMLQQQIAAKKGVPTPTANTLYFVYLPPGVRVVMGGSASCQAFCGYHNAIGGKAFYAGMPYPGWSGCTGGLAVFDALTSTSSHELCEAVTDPAPGPGWYHHVNGEVGEL